METEPVKLHTLAVLVENSSGVLSQVSRLFSRKGYNIDSLAVGPTDDPSVSRITIEVTTDEGRAKLLCNQLRKLLPVHSVRDLTDRPSLHRELMLVKVRNHGTRPHGHGRPGTGAAYHHRADKDEGRVRLRQECPLNCGMRRRAGVLPFSSAPTPESNRKYPRYSPRKPENQKSIH